MEAIAFLFFAALTLAVPITVLVVLILFHRRHRKLAARTDRLRQDLISTRGMVRRLENSVQALARGTQSTEEIPLLEISLDEPVEATEAPAVAAEPAVATVEPAPAPPPPAAPRGAGLERQLGTKVAVWDGAIALTFAGIFLVKYAILLGLR